MPTLGYFGEYGPIARGVATKFRLRGTDPDGGGGVTDSAMSRATTPKFRLLLRFCPLYFGNIGKSENFGKYLESADAPVYTHNRQNGPQN